MPGRSASALLLLLTLAPAPAHGDPLPPSARLRLGTARLRHGGEITTVAFAPDGRTVATAGRDQTVSLWDTSDGKELARYGAPECVALNFSENGRAIVWCDAGGTLYRCDAGRRGGDLDGRRERLRSFSPASGRIAAVAFMPDGSVAAPGSDSGDVFLWGTQKRIEIRIDGAVQGLALAPDGGSLAVNRGRAGVAVYDLAGREAAGPVRTFGADAVRSLAFSPDGRLLATGDFENRIQLWDAGTGRRLRGLEGHRRVPVSGRNGVFCLAFAPGGAALASGAADGTVRLWDVKTGAETACCAGHGGRVLALAFAPDGETLASGGADGVLRLWGPATGREVGPLKGAGGAVTAMSLSADGRSLALVRRPGGVRLWDLATGAEQAKQPPGAVAALAAAFAADGPTLVFAADGRLHFWDAARSESRRPPQEVRTSIRLLAAGGAGEVVAFSGDDGRVVLWDVGAGAERSHFRAPGHALSTLLFSPDGRRLIGAGTGGVTVWEVGAGAFDGARLPGAVGVLAAAVSPDGRMLATGGQDAAVRLWETASARPRRALYGDAAFVRAAAFSADSRLLATAGSNGAVRLWDVGSGRRLHTFAGHRGDVVAVAFAGERTLVTAGRDGAALVWDVPALLESGRGRTVELSAEKLQALWRDLGGDDAARAYEAAETLARTPRQSVPFLAERVPPVSAERLTRLLKDLDDDRYEARATAMKELARMGKFAEASLRKLLADRPSLEARRRAEELLDLLADPAAQAEHLRALRAVEVLEWVGTPEARAALRALAAGAADAPLSREAKAALGRLDRKP